MPRLHQRLRGENDTVASSVTIYTNSSGAGQAITCWGLTITLSANLTAVGTAFARAAIRIGGTILHNVSLVMPQNVLDSVSTSIDLGGAQFFLANAGVIDVFTDGNCTNCRAHGILVCDIDVGTA